MAALSPEQPHVRKAVPWRHDNAIHCTFPQSARKRRDLPPLAQ